MRDPSGNWRKLWGKTMQQPDLKGVEDGVTWGSRGATLLQPLLRQNPVDRRAELEVDLLVPLSEEMHKVIRHPSTMKETTL
eukprot:4868167-Prorocentrum_lima.AAC.1